ncbi:MAG TPA: hypothetical protein VHN15_13510 [Thermoanaerobaculia bacterium]|nr:hypothetical protein [Thermoanaerobaculia bacterium]
MAKDIAEGYLMVTERTFRMMTKPELDQLSFEIERHTRDLRGDQPALDDMPAIQLRNRRIQRLNTAVQILRSFRMKQRI